MTGRGIVAVITAIQILTRGVIEWMKKNTESDCESLTRQGPSWTATSSTSSMLTQSSERRPCTAFIFDRVNAVRVERPLFRNHKQGDITTGIGGSKHILWH